MSFDPTKNTLLEYVDKYSKLYRKIHPDTKESEVIEELSLNLGNEIILKLNQISENWKKVDKFESFRQIISRLERDIMSLENSNLNLFNNNLTSTVNKLINSALEDPVKGMKQILNQIVEKTKSHSENLAAIKHGNYNEQINSRYRNEYNKRRNRDWEEETDRQKVNRNKGKLEQPDTKKTRDLRRIYNDKFGEVSGPCYLCRGLHWRRHCSLYAKDLKEPGDRQ